MRAYDKIMEGLTEALQYEKGEIQVRKERVRVIVQPVPNLTAAKIKGVRGKLGLSQKAFADFMGVSTTTVEAWEGDKYPPRGPARRLFEVLEDEPSIANKFIKRHSTVGKKIKRIRAKLLK